ncbi:MAG: mycothiol conjugate amidase Mca [Ornithinibacter sp.]
MCVHAHPDDESSKGAATMARYVHEGVDVLVVTLTDGSRGSVLNPAMDRPEVVANITEIRAAEMEKARNILGVRQVFMGWVDSGLPEGDPLPPLPEGCFALEPLAVTSEALVREIRRFRPHVVTTYDENGGYPHPDHIMCHDVSMAAVVAAGDPEAFPHAGPAWQPLKVYYNQTFSRARIEAFHEALIALGEESPYAEWLENWSRPDRAVTTRVECAAWFERRDAALLAHATQVDPEGTWFRVTREVQARVWPTEDFEAALSFVPVAEGEDDLFAGIPTDVAQADALATSGDLRVALDTRTEREA